MVDCFSFSLLLGSNHPLLIRFRHLCQFPFSSNQTVVIHRFQPLYSMASSRAHDYFLQEANTISHVHFLMSRAWCHLDVTYVPLVNLGSALNKTMWKMWIQPLCACVPYPMGHVNAYAQIWAFVTSHKSHGLNTRFWLVEIKSAALWLVRTYRGHIHYWEKVYFLCMSANIVNTLWLKVYGYDYGMICFDTRLWYFTQDEGNIFQHSKHKGCV